MLENYVQSDRWRTVFNQQFFKAYRICHRIRLITYAYAAVNIIILVTFI